MFLSLRVYLLLNGLTWALLFLTCRAPGFIYSVCAMLICLYALRVCAIRHEFSWGRNCVATGIALCVWQLLFSRAPLSSHTAHSLALFMQHGFKCISVRPFTIKCPSPQLSHPTQFCVLTLHTTSPIWHGIQRFSYRPSFQWVCSLVRWFGCLLLSVKLLWSFCTLRF